MVHEERSLSDEELVRRVRAGEGDAARELFDRHRAELRAKVRRRLPRVLHAKVAASDVIQEAWLAAFLRLGDFEDRGDASFAKRVHRILEHKVMDEVRRLVGAEKRDARREAPLATDSSGACVAARGPSPSAELVASERSEMLHAQIRRLPDAHREIPHLVHDEGLTLVDAGARMGRSADAARKLYGRALAALTERLAGRGGSFA